MTFVYDIDGNRWVDGIKYKLGDFELWKWHFIELRENTVLPNYSYSASLSEWNDLVYIFIPTRVRRRLCAFFFRVMHVFFAYNGQTKTDCGIIFSLLLCVNVICKKHWMFALNFFQVVYEYSFRKALVFAVTVVEPLSHVKILTF